MARIFCKNTFTDRANTATLTTFTTCPDYNVLLSVSYVGCSSKTLVWVMGCIWVFLGNVTRDCPQRLTVYQPHHRNFFFFFFALQFQSHYSAIRMPMS
jgi:hypothetical protein